MLEFPRGTVFNKRIPKQKFYDNLGVSSNLEKQFTKEIDAIFWRNKLSPETLNISKGSNVSEIEIIEVRLKEQGISKSIIESIDREIPYHLVFILVYKDLCQIWISYKEDSKSRDGKFKVDSYYKTQWLLGDEVSLNIEGLNLDKVYENFMLQIAGGKLQIGEGKEIKDAVSRAKMIDRLESSINGLEIKIRNEKQYNRQVKLMGELRKLKLELMSYQE